MTPVKFVNERGDLLGNVVTESIPRISEHVHFNSGMQAVVMQVTTFYGPTGDQVIVTLKVLS